MEINEIPTPFFLLDERSLQGELSLLKNALNQYWANYTIGYSVKTNSLPALASILRQKDVSAEVVSEDEYAVISRVGYLPANIICNGPIKHENWIQELLDKNIKLNIDSHCEVEYVCKYATLHKQKRYSVGLRVNLDVNRIFPGESNAEDGCSRFGFSEASGELSAVIERLRQCSNVTIAGLHLHISTKCRRPEVYRWLVTVFASVVHKYHLTAIQYLDIGGGFYGGMPNKPSWNEYLQEISEELSLQGFSSEKLMLIVEPGVSLLAGCLSYFTKIVDIKTHVNQSFAVCDGSRIHIDPLMHKSVYFYKIITTKSLCSRKSTLPQQLVGFTCLENDRFFTLKDTLLFKDDIVRFEKVGAYTMSLSPLFISFFPAVYIMHTDGTISCGREKWSADEFMQLSKL